MIANEGRPTGIISRGTLLRHFCKETEVEKDASTVSDANEAESDDELATRIAHTNCPHELATRIALEFGTLVDNAEHLSAADEPSLETLST